MSNESNIAVSPSPIPAPAYWQAFAADLQTISDEVAKQFGTLSTEQLNWKPNTDTWSIAQCLEHLIIINKAYFDTFDKIVKDEKEFSFWESLPVLPSFFGKMLIKQLQPSNTQKYKTVEQMLPSSSALSGDIIEQFLAHQQQLINYVGQMNEVAHTKIILTSPVASFVTYNLADAMAIITIHEQRHYQQALRVQQSVNFPETIQPKQSNEQIVEANDELHPDSLIIPTDLPPNEIN